MGFMDNFTSDSPVTVKQPDYYAMVKEAAKAELITNAVNAEVPGYYIQAMITGKKPDFLNTLDAEEEETGFRTEYEQITGAVVSIFEAWEKENGVESAATGLHRLIDDLSKNRMPKTEKKRETSPSQSNLNDKNARRYLIRLANINFGKGDIWATFGWNNGLLPETYEDAKKDVVNFIRRINRKRKKLGLENAKYIYIIAFEEYTRPHFHLLISGGIDRDELERMWGKCDRPNTRNISPDENFLLTGLATYITQNPHGTKRWCPSKNLKKPDEPKRSYSKFRKAKVEKMAFDSSVLQAEMEKAYPGFTFLDAEVKHNGVNAAFYIYARMVKKGEKPKGKPQKRKRGNKA